jgi:hypothetical protein
MLTRDHLARYLRVALPHAQSVRRQQEILVAVEVSNVFVYARLAARGATVDLVFLWPRLVLGQVSRVAIPQCYTLCQALNRSSLH